ncbi:MAG: metal ABC transporter permease [Phycisphaeraceae bacterium]|nr:metal ABC transporter permease [Phycisphaeraceae bacterium]MCW5755291.1 metal ABC transporter permease [Phycisphaeraceae bacterium]
MNESTYTFIAVDLPAMLALTLACLTCGLLGNYLVLRRESLMGDAIAHSVLPGIVLAFLLTGSRDAFPMFLGAAGAGVVAVILIDALCRYGRVERSAAMGVVFCVLFAAGVLLLRLASAENVDLDADCVLYGQPETIIWYPPAEWSQFFTWATLVGYVSPEGHAVGGVPSQVVALACTLLVTVICLRLFHKELALAAFDPGLAGSLGFSPVWITRGLMVLIAAATVVSFEAIGSILVIAMLICPGATARLCTDKLKHQIRLSGAFAAASGLIGYIVGAFGPGWLGFEGSLIVSGSATVIAGLLLVAAMIAAPGQGLISVRRRRTALERRIAREDVIAMVYRAEELGQNQGLSFETIRRSLASARAARLGISAARRSGHVVNAPAGVIRLTDKGREEARTIVRSHRLWELFLVRELGIRPDHVHPTAERLEHLRDASGRIMPQREHGELDPHDRQIP